MAPNRKAIIEKVMAQFTDRLVNDPAETDRVGRRLLPRFIEAMPAEDAGNWGVLEKRTTKPYNVPYDILVWKPTREHFDVLTSRAVSGDEKNDKTGPRRLVPTWGDNKVLPKSSWHWCDWRSTANPIIPLETGNAEPEPAPEPQPDPVEPGPDRISAMAAFLSKQTDKFVALMNETKAGLEQFRS